MSEEESRPIYVFDRLKVQLILLSDEEAAITDEREFRRLVACKLQRVGDGMMAEWRRRQRGPTDGSAP